MPLLRSGYSGKPLFQKLGVNPGKPFFALDPPPGYEAWLELPAGSPALKARLGKEESLIHAFLEDEKGLKNSSARLLRALSKDGSLWVSWRKGKKEGLKETAIRTWALSAGLVDVKVCSVNEEWSALKIVWRKENR